VTAGKKASPGVGIVRGTPGADLRPSKNFCILQTQPSRVLNLAGTEAAGALGLLLLADSDDVDLEVVELEDS
jgi:hypothetical protein